MKFTKIFLKILISLVVPFLIIFFPIEPLYNSFNLVRIVGTSCCGLTLGDTVRHKEFDSLILKRGDVVFYEDYQKNDLFARVIAFPGEYVFSDLHAGKWGYIKSDAPPKLELNESEIIQLFSDITWLDYPTFQETISSENLYDRLILISGNATKYQVINDAFGNADTTALDPAQIFGVFDSVFIPAGNVSYFYVALIIVYLLLAVIIYVLLS